MNFLFTLRFLEPHGDLTDSEFSQFRSAGGSGIGGIAIDDFTDSSFIFHGFDFEFLDINAFADFPASFSSIGISFFSPEIRIGDWVPTRVSEPASLALFGLGLLGLGLARRRGKIRNTRAGPKELGLG